MKNIFILKIASKSQLKIFPMLKWDLGKLIIIFQN